jgi:hypothetical protein
MSDAALMLRELAEPWGAGERVKTVIGRVSLMSKLEYWRTFDIWYRKARRIEQHEMQQIEEALRIKKEKAARNELHDLKIRLAKLEAAMLSRTSDVRSPATDYGRNMVREFGGANRAVAGRVSSHTHPKDPPNK